MMQDQRNLWYHRATERPWRDKGEQWEMTEDTTETCCITGQLRDHSGTTADDRRQGTGDQFSQLKNNSSA